MRYNIWRPVMLIAVVFLTRSLVMNLSLILGATEGTADSLAMLAAVIAAFVMYYRFTNGRRRKK
ncbi:hypothetical protein [Paenibacillus tengchongensis]|uniref:hypothetical protein n=1 Tax=Paenibacillus tengchongensis TaxID=2608684 RepID=UPI00124CB4C7|nr:hypothetical protein [Paenibacillus tengchongensis]